MAADGVGHLIRTSSAQPWSRPCEWVLALPVLHFLRHDIRPFDYPKTADLGSPRWWGLENLMKDVKSFTKMQTASRLVSTNRLVFVFVMCQNDFIMCRSPLTLIDEIKPLCFADRLTARSFLYSLTLQQLPHAVEAGVAHPSEFLQALQDKLFDTSKGSTIARKTVTHECTTECHCCLHIDFAAYRLR